MNSTEGIIVLLVKAIIILVLILFLIWVFTAVVGALAGT